MKLPDDAKIIKRLVEKCLNHRCRTVYRSIKVGYERWTVFSYYVNGEVAVSFRTKDSFQEVMIYHYTCYQYKEFTDSIFLLFPDMVIITCV